jgi:hypothetical protein
MASAMPNKIGKNHFLTAAGPSAPLGGARREEKRREEKRCAGASRLCSSLQQHGISSRASVCGTVEAVP